MPPKRKDILKPKGKAPAKNIPQTENDFLEDADDHEQAAGKWRAGDVAKATRFFKRAIEVYDEGLKRFPGSFDLAYNKAVLEYNLTQDDRILPHLGPRIALLEETLKSHQTALSLSPDSNTDILFNTAQVLTSFAEAVLDARTQQTAKVSARALLEEAVGLFTKCLGLQQEEYERVRLEIEALKAYAAGEEHAQQELPQAGTTRGGMDEDFEITSTTSSAPGEWATIEEPLTPETILETCTAQLGALTTLLGLYDPSEAANIETRVQNGLATGTMVIPTLINLIQDSPFKKEEENISGPTLSIGSPISSEELETTPKDDALLAVATFQAALAELQYKASQITSTQYATTIETVFVNITQPTQTEEQRSAYMNAVSAYADALIDLASAVCDSPAYGPTSSTHTTDQEVQWTSLTHAQKLLTQLSTAPHSTLLPPSRLADTFLARGDVELFRFHLSFSPSAKPAWVNAKSVLVGNAGVYYRGARTYAEKAGKADVRETADAKALVAEVMKEVNVAGGVIGVPKEAWKKRSGGVKRVLEQMVEEGILGREEAEGVLNLLN
ncbi:hypothetical protein P280DRAFT_448872 [Massarina eburnea CBS 473.64]|uniref:TPR-like protein n=1 Tax=Massarina eburnea CBS 473.64 TaxID=1395130 RepID=A0A6A6S2E4_9PLEO|nr:hypothetical protein P280DRAFT_448872 [Massarina eburnea CBS 473.64]